MNLRQGDMRAKIAVAGAGIYGGTVAIRLAEQGHAVRLFDPLGIMRAASAINQYRVHAGYHYPRSPETIQETLAARAEFIRAFEPAIVRNSRHHYAIPKQGSRTPPDVYEKVMKDHGLPLKPCRPDWMNFGFIDRCYEVAEHVYDPEVLRELVEARIRSLNIPFERKAFTGEMRSDFDFVVWATYALGPSRGVFKIAKFQVAEKMLIELPPALQHIALVVVDGDRKSTRLNSSHLGISYAVFCLKKKKKSQIQRNPKHEKDGADLADTQGAIAHEAAPSQRPNDPHDLQEVHRTADLSTG